MAKPTRHGPRRSWNLRHALLAIAIVLAIGEFAGALAIDWPAGILFLGGAYWIRRGGLGGPVLVGLLAAIEAVAVPVTGPYAQWAQNRPVVQVLAVVVCLTGLIASTRVIVNAIKRRPQPLNP